jgi:hypothetical protein
MSSSDSGGELGDLPSLRRGTKDEGSIHGAVRHGVGVLW